MALILKNIQKPTAGRRLPGRWLLIYKDLYVGAGRENGIRRVFVIFEGNYRKDYGQQIQN